MDVPVSDNDRKSCLSLRQQIVAVTHYVKFNLVSMPEKPARCKHQILPTVSQNKKPVSQSFHTNFQFLYMYISWYYAIGSRRSKFTRPKMFQQVDRTQRRNRCHDQPFEKGDTGAVH